MRDPLWMSGDDDDVDEEELEAQRSTDEETAWEIANDK